MQELLKMIPPGAILPMVEPAIKGLMDELYRYAAEKHGAAVSEGNMLVVLLPQNPVDKRTYFMIAQAAVNFSNPVEVLESTPLEVAIGQLNLEKILAEANG